MKTRTASRVAAIAAAVCAAGCFSVKTESEIKPIHITMDVNLKVDKALEKAFADEYNGFVSGIVKNLNEELWDSVELSEEIHVKADFFGIYDDSFGTDK